MTFLAAWGYASDFLGMLPKFKMAERCQRQFFLWVQKLQNLKSEIIQILLSHSQDMDMYKWFFKVLLKFKMAAMDKPYFFVVGAKTEKLKSVIIHIVQSHYPPSGNVQVILLKFKMGTTNRLFTYLWPQKVWPNLWRGMI